MLRDAHEGSHLKNARHPERWDELPYPDDRLRASHRSSRRMMAATAIQKYVTRSPISVSPVVQLDSRSANTVGMLPLYIREGWQRDKVQAGFQARDRRTHEALNPIATGLRPPQKNKRVERPLRLPYCISIAWWDSMVGIGATLRHTPSQSLIFSASKICPSSIIDTMSAWDIR